MESDLGKLFIGGISWDTDEDRLREYFQGFGEVVEAVIMRDRASGRARGFGFIVFSDPAIAERVVLEKHLIDGRMVEAKKAVPRDDHSILSRNSNTIQGSPGPTRTKKIFVGGLPSTITDTEFRNHFEQFGPVTDVVVMYDHNTQRPRGFGFITYESEESVDRVLVKTFHELSGKMVEVKRAVPKELSPSPNMRSPITGYNYGITRLNSFLNGYSGFNPSPIGAYGFRTDPRFGPLGSGRSGFASLSPGYGIGMNFEPGMNTSYGNSLNLNNNISYGRTLSPYYSENSNRFSSPIGYGGGNISPGSIFNSPTHNLWGNNIGNNGGNNMNAARSISYLNSGNGSGDFGSTGINWERSSSPISSNNMGNFGLGGGTSNFGFGGGGVNFGRSSGQVVSGNSSLNALNSGYERDYSDSFGNRSIYEDTTWRSASLDLDSSGPFRYGLEDDESDVMEKSSTGFVGGSFNVTSRQTNGVSGIAA